MLFPRPLNLFVLCTCINYHIYQYFHTGIGLVLNLLSLWVLLEPTYYNIHPTNVYLVAMAVSDMGFLATSIYTSARTSQMNKNTEIKIEMTTSECFFQKLFSILWRSTRILLTIVVTWERHLAVCDPFKSKMKMSRSKAYKVPINCYAFSDRQNI